MLCRNRFCLLRNLTEQWRDDSQHGFSESRLLCSEAGLGAEILNTRRGHKMIDLESRPVFDRHKEFVIIEDIVYLRLLASSHLHTPWDFANKRKWHPETRDWAFVIHDGRSRDAEALRFESRLEECTRDGFCHGVHLPIFPLGGVRTHEWTNKTTYHRYGSDFPRLKNSRHLHETFGDPRCAYATFNIRSRPTDFCWPRVAEGQILSPLLRRRKWTNPDKPRICKRNWETNKLYAFTWSVQRIVCFQLNDSEIPRSLRNSFKKVASMKQDGERCKRGQQA